MDLILWTAFKGIVLLGIIFVGIGLIGLYLKNNKGKEDVWQKRRQSPNKPYKPKYIQPDDNSAIVKPIRELPNIEQAKPSIFEKKPESKRIIETQRQATAQPVRSFEPLSAEDEADIEAILDNIAPLEDDKELQQATWPYKRKPLLTFTEQRFFALLHEALPEHQIFVQVALNQMIKVDGKHNWANWYNRIAQMSVDFVISDTKGYVIAAIELDDKTHDNDKSRAKDAKKDKALNSAGIQVLRYRCEAMPSINRVQKDVEKIYSLMPTK